MSPPELIGRYCRDVPRHRERKPPSYWAGKGRWPYSHMREEAPPTAALVQGIAARLREALNYKSLTNPNRITTREAAAAAGISPATVTNIINGTTWPDADSIARLERAFDIDLWGREHRTQSDQDSDDDQTGGEGPASEESETAGYTEDGDLDGSPDDIEDEAEEQQSGYTEFKDPDDPFGAASEDWRAEFGDEEFDDSDDWLAR